MDQSELCPRSGVQIYAIPAEQHPHQSRWYWRLMWSGEVVGASQKTGGFDSKADAYQDLIRANCALDMRLGRKTWRTAEREELSPAPAFA